jgi:chorismate dehydratase
VPAISAIEFCAAACYFMGGSMADEITKLRMAADNPTVAAKWLEREQAIANREREFGLDSSLGKFRVGSVKALNAVPLTRGLESEVIYDVPAKLAQLLQRDELDAALVSVVEALFHDRYDILDTIAVASLGEVKSVFLAHRKPLEEVTEVFCDPASLTSVTLLKVLMAERDLRPEFKPLENYAAAPEKDFVLLIGDAALDFHFANEAQPTHEIFDLGAEWTELTGLPFVYAVWAMRRGVHTPELRRQLREARDFGLDTLDYIISSRTEYTLDFRKDRLSLGCIADYIQQSLHYHLGSDEKRGIAKFVELLRKHNFSPVFEPNYVF